MAKPWHRKRQPVRYHKIRDRILIVCEGEKTEPNYFRRFPVKSEVIVVGVGKNTISLVEEAVRRKRQAEKKGAPYNQVWCVFDRDEFPADNFKDALSLASENGVETAYSNQCFELWYYLHFEYTTVAHHRNRYSDLLTKCLKKEYRKNIIDMYDQLLDRQRNAITNAEKLLASYDVDVPEKNDPSTKVHLLVLELNKRIEAST